MPYLTAEHVSLSLNYLAENAHPSLVTFLSMTRAGVPCRTEGVPGAPFGNPQENAVLDEFFILPGGGNAGPALLRPIRSHESQHIALEAP